MISPERTISTSEKAIIQLLDLFQIAQIKSKIKPRDLILTYHSVESERSGYKFAVSTQAFSQQIDYLATFTDLVSLEQLKQPSNSSRPRIALTFDDAYADFYDNVYPILKSKNIPAVVFVPTRFIENRLGLLERDESISKPHLTWEQMRQIATTSRIEFGSHTHSHKSAVDTIKTLQADVQQSIAELEKNLGMRPNHFAYPYGQYNADTNDIVQTFGFETICTMDNSQLSAGPVQGRLDVYDRNQQLPYFKLTAAGLLSPGMRNIIRQTIYGQA